MRWLSRMFGKKPEPWTPIDMRGLNEDWHIGDLAVCVREDWKLPQPFDPRTGEMLRVSLICEGEARGGGFLVSALGFEGKPTLHAWACNAFRKIRPERTEAEAEFTALIKRPVRTPTKV